MPATAVVPDFQESAATPPPFLVPLHRTKRLLQQRQFGLPGGIENDVDSCIYIALSADCYEIGIGYANCFSDVTFTINEECVCSLAADMSRCAVNALEGTNCLEDFASDIGVFEAYIFSIYGCTSLPPTLFTPVDTPVETPVETPVDAPVDTPVNTPTTVSIDLESVRVVTPTTPVTPPARTFSPLFQGTGELLTGKCAEQDYTLVDSGSIVLWAAVAGCNGNRPECCPWRARQTGIPDEQAFPVPQDPELSVLAECPDDYYTIPGSSACCPVGHFPYTTEIGGQTPCWRQQVVPTNAPDLTAGIDFTRQDDSKTTIAVVNVVYSMQYPTAGDEDGSQLPIGAIVGIAIGGTAAVIIISLLVLFLIRSRRKKAKGSTSAAAAAMAAGAPPTTTTTTMTEDKRSDRSPSTIHALSTHNAIAYSPSTRTISTLRSSGTPSQLLPHHQTNSLAGVSELGPQEGYHAQPVHYQQHPPAIPEGAPLYGQLNGPHQPTGAVRHELSPEEQQQPQQWQLQHTTGSQHQQQHHGYAYQVPPQEVAASELQVVRVHEMPAHT